MKKPISAAAALTFITMVAVGAAAPASATVPDAQGGSLVVHGVDVDAARAAGAVVRAEPDGRQLVTLPSGMSLVVRNGHVEPRDQRGTSVGNCGTSTIAGNRTTRKYSTGYVISPAWGAPVSHSWTVTVSTSNSVHAYDNSGLAPISSSWNSGWKSISQVGSINSMLASGNVLTSWGMICSSGNPTWE